MRFLMTTFAIFLVIILGIADLLTVFHIGKWLLSLDNIYLIVIGFALLISTQIALILEIEHFKKEE